MVGKTWIYHFYTCIVDSQFEIEWIFSLVGIFTNLRKCQQLDNLDKLIFVNKNWPNNCRIGCKPFFSLVDLIEVDIKLEEELKEFEGTFEKDRKMCNILIIL